MFKNPFSFNGRIRRSEYGISLIIYILAASTVQLIFSAVGVDDPSILKQTIPYRFGGFFISFTCYKWLPLVEKENGYARLNNWFDVVNKMQGLHTPIRNKPVKHPPGKS